MVALWLNIASCSSCSRYLQLVSPLRPAVLHDLLVARLHIALRLLHPCLQDRRLVDVPQLAGGGDVASGLPRALVRRQDVLPAVGGAPGRASPCRVLLAAASPPLYCP